MVINISQIKQAELLVNTTKQSQINWVNVEFLKEYLRENRSNFNTIQVLHEYLVHLQREKFVFDCKETYLTVCENILFAFSKGKHSFTYRLDSVDLMEGRIEWEKYKIPENMLLRIRNTIEFVSRHTDEKTCVDLISTISSDNLF